MTIGYLGYGRMGQAIETLAVAAGHETGLRIDKDNMDERTPERLQQCDVILEFSEPSSAFNNIEACLRAKVPVVSGTTGWLDRMPDALAICAEEDGALFYASNFSVGVNIFFALNQYLARLMKDLPQYRPKITEAHHIHKKDAPSGTAITLAESILKELPQYLDWKLAGEEKEGILPIHSIREGEIPGTHQIDYQSSIDDLQLMHTAHSRTGFAEGALQAAKWIIGRQGFYEMADLLGWR